MHFENHISGFVCLFGCLVGWFLNVLVNYQVISRPQDRASDNFYMLLHMRQSWETMSSISAGHIILTPTQPVGSGRPQRGSNPGPPDQESRALPTELPCPPCFRKIVEYCTMFFNRR